MFERLKAKWNINSNVQLIIIFIVFAITGSLSLQITKPILIYIGVDSGYLKTFFLGYFLYVLIRIFILFPVYQILLIAIGTLFGQFDFFSNFTKNTFRKIFLKLFNKIASNICLPIALAHTPLFKKYYTVLFSFSLINLNHRHIFFL